MSALKPVLLALSMMLVAPVMVHASEITLIPAVKLQIGDQDHDGNYWDGDHWRDRDWWEHHYEWRDNHWHEHEDKHWKHHHGDHDDRGEYHDRHGDGDSQH
ncbi:DUF2502 domain-containing protein [[Enterobacter] lignolyticus]|uniref:DUF2502 domain-containing protein n=2 Tax=[Enterobacter] lignolyticus TaxID=1334193 RepID=E3GAP3_ENTLS|nr:DUF2502 domain-containing protein [[Enterobacter] lignolyticus]ADO49954.1 Protein of unknown function DUF2502 [[Enterobacter] lignolyticus SCF1]ALR75370.1 hypothetical protein AO703_03340 [[Enterobacter] lignolyticus]